MPIGIAVACFAIGGLYYLQVIINSSEKWFHLLIVAMLAFAGIQVNQFYLNQKEIEAKMQIFMQKRNKASEAAKVAETKTASESDNSP